MKIICIKLSSGEELIARLAPQPTTLYGTNVPTPVSPYDGAEPWLPNSADLIVENVCIVAVHPVGNGQVGIGFSPWAVGNQAGKFRIASSHVTAVYSPVRELEDAFIQQTTGIAMPGNTRAPTLKM